VLCNFVHGRVGCRKTSSKKSLDVWVGEGVDLTSPLFVTLWMSDLEKGRGKVIYNVHKFENLYELILF